VHRGGDQVTALIARRRAKPERVLVNGKPIRARFFQQTITWGSIVAACGAALVAGVYFGVLQVDWHIWLGSTKVQLFYLKDWWDGGMGIIHQHTWLIDKANWKPYRHGLRDKGEPAVALMAVATLMAAPKLWSRRVGKVRLFVTPLVLLALAFVLIIGSVWLIGYAPLPGGHRGVGSLVSFPSWLFLLTLASGLIIGHVLKPVWAPVGAHVQGRILDRAVDRWQASGGGQLPLWVRQPLAPPVIRERFCLMAADPDNVIEVPQHRPWVTALFAALRIIAVILVIGLIALGFVAHFWIGTGHSFPYLAP
jgi:hypothetical protein